MIKKKTTLILGAGASNHFGYPIGSDLMRQIYKHGNVIGFKKIHGNVFSKDDIDEFIISLSRSQYYSIDEFLEHKTDFLDIGKVFITYILKRNENEDVLFRSHHPGWYQYLFNSIYGNSLDNTADNKLSIITYNYDRSLECFLHQAIKYRFNLSEHEALDVLNQLNIIHIHGILGKYPDFPYKIESDTRTLIEISKGIKIVSELDDKENGFCSEEYAKSFDFLKHSENIYFLGFGFHDNNLRRFNFFKPANIENKNIMATFYRLGKIDENRLITRLSEYGLSNIKHGNNSCNDFFSHIASLE